MKKQLLIFGAFCLGMLGSLWVNAQTEETVTLMDALNSPPVEKTVDLPQSLSVEDKLELLSAVDPDKVTVVHEDKALEIPEGETPKGGWFFPLYTAEGTYKTYRIQEPNKFKQISDCQFSISADEKNRWQMQLSTYEEKYDIHSTYHFFSDGTNTFDIVFSDKVFDWDYKLRDSTPDDISTASIFSGQVPKQVPMNQWAGEMWLSFCGGKYLAEQNGTNIYGKYKLVDVMKWTDWVPQAWACDFYYQLCPFPHPLISSGFFALNRDYISVDPKDYWWLNDLSDYNTSEILEYLKNAPEDYLYLDDITLKAQKQINEKLNVPVSVLIKTYGEGFAPFDYSIEKEKQSNDMLEKSFSDVIMKGNKVGLSPLKPSGVPDLATIINVTNIITTPRAMPLLPVFGSVSVEDHRFWEQFKSKKTLYYGCTNEWKIGLDYSQLKEVQAQYIEERSIPRNKGQNNSDESARNLYYICIAGLVLVLLLSLTVFILKKKKQTNL
jgi:hypothetical protein